MYFTQDVELSCSQASLPVGTCHHVGLDTGLGVVFASADSVDWRTSMDDGGVFKALIGL
jgi:hypothetical protein